MLLHPKEGVAFYSTAKEIDIVGAAKGGTISEEPMPQYKQRV